MSCKNRPLYNQQNKRTKQNNNDTLNLSPDLRQSNNIGLLNDGISIRQIYGDRLKYINKNALNNFVGTVYNNFKELSQYPQLKHTPEELYRLLTSPNLIMYTVAKNNVMIGYCCGELMRLDDGRFVLFIAYIYIGSKYRRNGLGSVLLNKIIEYARFKSMDAITLICDTEDNRVMQFYFDKGFMYDPYLRRYDKYDVLTLNL
jgi:GNAT superfamily N-acetyltransferase